MWEQHVSRQRGGVYYARPGAQSRWETPASEVARMYDAVEPSAPPPDHVAKMRRQNNNGKRDLFGRVPMPVTNVLDLCCGQGGDLRKISHTFTDLRTYTGIDASERCVREARRRIDAGGLPPAVTAIVQKRDLLCRESWVDLRTGTWDLVSMQMALHYFAEDEKMLSYTLRYVSSCLRKGGHFVATVLDDAMVRDTDFLREHADFFSVEWRTGDPEGAYRFCLPGSVNQGAYEFVVAHPLLEELALQAGMVCESRIPLAPSGPSRLYVGVVFRKI
mgnify:CR=1 FL=1